MQSGSRETERARPPVVLAVLSLSAMSYAVLSSEVIPALPALQSSLRTSETGVTWLLTGFLLSASVGTTAWGWAARPTLALLSAGLAVCTGAG